MAEVLLKDVPAKTQSMFNKGLGALERGHLDHAIEMLSAVLELEPALLQARKFLRAAEIRKFKDKKGGALFHKIAVMKGMPLLFKGMALMKGGKPLQALAVAEKLLGKDPLNVIFSKFFAEASTASDLPEAAVQTLEIIRDHSPEDASILKILGDQYVTVGRTKDARAVFEKVCALYPKDPQALRKLKDAMALDTMASDGWTKAADGGGYRDMIKDEEEAVRLEQQAKAVRSETDTGSLIEETLKKIEAEPENMNYYRALARLYSQNNMFDEAIATVEKAIKRSPGDPDLDNTRTQITLRKFDHEINSLRATGDEAGVADKVLEREQFTYDNLQERVARYPNDLRLRYELGVILHDNNHLNEAIKQFQLSQRSPKDRIMSLYYMARSFHKKGQLDMALEQLKMADSELGVMDGTKKDVSYEIGEIAQEMGNTELAAEYYKKIYQSDIGYKDISAKIEQLYKEQKKDE